MSFLVPTFQARVPPLQGLPWSRIQHHKYPQSLRQSFQDWLGILFMMVEKVEVKNVPRFSPLAIELMVNLSYRNIYTAKE